jgi:hypothetical protein
MIGLVQQKILVRLIEISLIDDLVTIHLKSIRKLTKVG